MSLLESSLDEIEFISSTHGKERRALRGIEKIELKKAVKYGKKERIFAPWTRKPRCKYTVCNTVIYASFTHHFIITDPFLFVNNLLHSFSIEEWFILLTIAVREKLLPTLFHFPH